MEAISSKTLKSTLLPVPPMEEQVKLEKVFRSIDEELSALEAKRESLSVVKKGLMQDLLTGKVRVKT